MWPMFVDYTEDECKRVLRSLELEAYAAIINAFRAQGYLSKDKRKILQELCNMLSISIERHRAEIRRAVNDEHLNTVAEKLCGSNTHVEWAIEGRRVVPLMQRLAPQTVFTDIANSAANAQATKNASLPLPGRTGLREISNGVETMASRKRRELPPDPSIPPNKLPAMDYQHLNVPTFDSTSFQAEETPSCSEIPTSESLPTNEVTIEPTPLSDYISSKIPPMANVPSLVSPVKSSAKHVMMKSSSSTVTTFSSFDQMTSNLLASKQVSRTPLQSMSHEGHTTVAETLKSMEPKSLQRTSSTGAMRTTVIPHTVPSTGSTSSSDRSASSTSSQSKFVSQLRSKPAVQGRQNLPSGLGVKLNIQPQVNQRAVSPSSKGKHDSSSSFLAKKQTSGVFPPMSLPDPPVPQFTVNDSLTITKTTPVQKSPAPKTESQPTPSHQPVSKVPVTKTLPKVSSSSNQYISRSLFGGGTKGSKSLPPVIFNVSSSANMQTSTKTTGPVQSEAGKGSCAQLLPKPTAIGVSQNHMKLGTSTTQTIQYRNDGGLVRSARIINVTPPAGSRLPCSITPSAISALGLSSNLTSGALRVTLPAGTLNTASSMRASAAAKPNVIVVHKAQMWPRSLMSPNPPLQRIPDSSSENTQKQEKSKSSTSSAQSGSSTASTKPHSRPLTSPRPQSPSVSTVPVKDTASIRTPSPSPAQQTDSSSKETPVPTNKNTSVSQVSSKSQPSTLSLKNQVNTGTKSLAAAASEVTSRKNLLTDVMEASGLTIEATNKSTKEKGDLTKREKDKPIKTTILPGETTIKPVHDSTPIPKTVLTSSVKSIDTSSEASSLSVPDTRDSQVLKRHEKGDDSLESKETVITISTMEIPTKNVMKKQTDDSKDKNS